jgi:hypothetical protein
MEKEMGLHEKERVGDEDGGAQDSKIAESDQTAGEIDEKGDATTTTATTTTEPELEYISGVRLFLVITATTLVVFLMMLDMSIIVTV